MSNDIKPISEADYEAIEQAVLETSRGRWFLAEYARRNRNADTAVLLEAIKKLERTVEAQPSTNVADSVDQIRFDVVEMAAAIAQTKREIAAIRPEGEQQGHAGVAADELDAIVESTEKATQDILEATEQIQEIAWSIREEGVRDEVCDELDKLVTEIYTASSFQDLTGQRISKVVSVLGYLKDRLEAMRQIWGDDDTVEVHGAVSETENPDAHLLNGPQLVGNGLDQFDIDLMIAEDGEAPEANREEEPELSANLVSIAEPEDSADPELAAEDEIPAEPELSAEPESQAEPEPSDASGLLVETELEDDEVIVFAEDDGDDDGALALDASEEIVTFSGDDDAISIDVTDMNGQDAASDVTLADDDILPESFDDEEIFTDAGDAAELADEPAEIEAPSEVPEEDDHIIMVRKPLSNGSADASLWREALDPPVTASAGGGDPLSTPADELSAMWGTDKAALFS